MPPWKDLRCCSFAESPMEACNMQNEASIGSITTSNACIIISLCLIKHWEPSHVHMTCYNWGSRCFCSWPPQWFQYQGKRHGQFTEVLRNQPPNGNPAAPIIHLCFVLRSCFESLCWMLDHHIKPSSVLAAVKVVCKAKANRSFVRLRMFDQVAMMTGRCVCVCVSVHVERYYPQTHFGSNPYNGRSLPRLVFHIHPLDDI